MDQEHAWRKPRLLKLPPVWRRDFAGAQLADLKEVFIKPENAVYAAVGFRPKTGNALNQVIENKEVFKNWAPF